ncbi:MAG: hypothetical protein CMJ58_10940 [Planctomycetaceae bacterium]|nr:hypothetical protein [Planctomycetaceae bacterium]
MVEVDIDGMDDGPFTPSPNFTFGGDTTTASTSVAGTAYGLTGGDSLFGGDGVNEPDTYVYRYDPTTDVDNLNTAGVVLGLDLAGNGVIGSGLAGGAAGAYRVYATWPATTNVNANGVNFTATSGSSSFTVNVDQNGYNGEWIYLGYVQYDGSSGIILTQEAVENSFVSMRAAAALFEPVPEPMAVTLAAIAFGTLAVVRRQR